MSFENFQVRSPTGASLCVYRDLPKATPRAVVQINHGMAEHAGRYAWFAERLANAGYAVYAQDHRGHGATTAPGSARGHFASGPGREVVLRDVDAVHDHIASAHPELPVVVFGHSMGGLITLNWLMQRSGRVKAAAVWNANFSGGVAGRAAQALLAWEKFRLGSDVPSRLLPKLTFRAWARQIKDRRTEFDWLSHDAAQVDAYIRDPRCGFDFTVGAWQTVFAMIMAGADDRQVAAIPPELPINLVGGAEDPATENGKAVGSLRDRLRKLGFSSLRSTIYAHTRHESLNELNRDIIAKDFIEWLDRMVPHR